jgi:hypothetical protein
VCSPLSSSKSQECLSASQATLQKVDLSGGGVEVRPLHSSLTGGQDSLLPAHYSQQLHAVLMPHCQGTPALDPVVSIATDAVKDAHG